MTRAWMALVVVSCLAGSAGAGQLHVQQFGLKEVMDRGDSVLIGRVTGGAGEGRALSVTVEVTRIYTGRRTAAATSGGKPIAVGDVARFDIYTGVVWTDPRKSPLDRRLRGHLGDAVPAAGTVIAVVPSMGGAHEMMKLDEVSERSLEILYDADPAARMKKEPEARLEADLKNLDLAGLARAELASRGRLTAMALLDGDPDFLYAHYRAMPPAERISFLKELVPLTKNDRALRLRAARATLGELSAEAIPVAAALVAQLDWSDRDEARYLHDVWVALLAVAGAGRQKDQKLDLSLFGDYLAESTVRRPAYRDGDDDLARLLAFCDRPTRARLAVRFLGSIYTSSRARGDDHDHFLLGTAVDLAREAPSAALWEPLQRLDPERPRVTSTKELLLNAMIEIGTALARHDHAFKDRVRDLLGPMMRDGLDIREDVKKGYRDHVGAMPRGAPALTILELRPGERRRLPSGETVLFKIDKGEVVVAIARPDGSSEERMLAAGEDWYREWYLPPYVIVVRRVGESVNLRFIPADKDPAMEPADAHAIAKKICDKRGATGESTQDPRDGDGIYTYEAMGGAKPCRIRIGIRTKKVLP